VDADRHLRGEHGEKVGREPAGGWPSAAIVAKAVVASRTIRIGGKWNSSM
jgi:hypothetical protein